MKMIQKIMCIGIISLFLLSGLGAASTLSINYSDNLTTTEVKETSSNSVIKIPGEVIVMLEEEAKPSGSFSSFLVSEYGGTSVKTYTPDLVKVKVKQGTEQNYIASIKKDARVKYAISNFAFRCCDTTPNDPRYDEQWGLEKIKCPKAWDTTTGSRDVRIAILDTGVDYDHLDLAANCVAGCDYVDVSPFMYPGYTFVDGEDYTNWDNDPDDFDGHGTHCAGIVGASGNNNMGVCGVNWQCSIIPLRVGFHAIDNSNGLGTGLMDPTACAAAIYYAADPAYYDADVISMSWGFLTDDQETIDLFEEYINRAWNFGAVLVAATGNDGEEQCVYPARYDHVIGVGAIDENGNRCSFSNYGTGLSLMAPGEDILSTGLPGYDTYSGTSCACPFVAGVAALAIARYPEDSNQEIRDLLEDSADETGDGTAKYYGNGLVDAALVQDLYPPTVSIQKPKNAFYLNGKALVSGTLYPLILGPINVEVYTEDDCGIDKVEYYVGDKLKYTDDRDGEGVYSWYWNEQGHFGRNRYLKVIAYDEDGNTGQDQVRISLYYM